jgi:uncharacterized protein (TIGR03067 family)
MLVWRIRLEIKRERETSNMKRLAIGLVLGLVVAPFAAADEKAEIAKLRGKWQVTAMEMRGMKMPAESIGPLKMAVLELGDGKLAIRAGDRVLHEGTFKIDASDTPKTIEGALMANVGRNKGKGNGETIGIYEVDGDTLRICFGGPGGGRPPKEFKTTGEGGGSSMVTYRRAK